MEADLLGTQHEAETAHLCSTAQDGTRDGDAGMWMTAKSSSAGSMRTEARRFQYASPLTNAALNMGHVIHFQSQ